MLPLRNKLHTRNLKHRGNTPYGSKRYANPFFQAKRRKKLNIDPKISWKIKAIIFVIVLITVALTWLFLYSPYFTIKNINANGEGIFVAADKVKNVAESQISSNMFILKPQKNIFFFNVESLRKNLQEKYSFDSLVITKKLPNTLNIKYVEKKYSIIWLEDNRYYYIDNAGAIISETNLNEIQQKDYPLIANISDQKIQNNLVTVDPKYLQYASNLYEQMKLHTSDVKVGHFVIDNDLNTVKIALQNGPQVYFNTSEAIDKQISKLLIVKREKIKDSFQSKSYIDVRIGDAVYYR